MKRILLLSITILTINSCLFNSVKKNKISNNRYLTYINRESIFEQEISKYGLNDGDTLVDVGFSNTIFDELIFSFFPSMHFVLEDVKFNIHNDDYFQYDKSRELEKFKRNSIIIKGKTNSIPLPSSEYKVVLCRNTLHEFVHLNSMISEMKRIVKDNGFVIVLEQRAIVENQLCGMGHKLLTDKEITNVFLQNGFILNSSHIIYRKNGNSPSTLYKFYKK